MAVITAYINPEAPAIAGKTDNPNMFNHIDIDGFLCESFSARCEMHNNLCYTQLEIRFKKSDVDGKSQIADIKSKYTQLNTSFDTMSFESMGKGKGVSAMVLAAQSKDSEGVEVESSCTFNNVVGSLNASGTVINAYATSATGKAGTEPWLDVPEGANQALDGSQTSISVY